jgi:hypothetical protein
MLCPVACNGLYSSVVPLEWNDKPNDSVTGFDHFKVILTNAGLGCSTIKEKLDLFQESGLSLLVSVLTKLIWGMCKHP